MGNNLCKIYKRIQKMGIKEDYDICNSNVDVTDNSKPMRDYYSPKLKEVKT